MATDHLKVAMLRYVPQLAKEYKEFVRSIFKRMVADLGPSLKGVYSSRRWANNWHGIQANTTQTIKRNPTGSPFDTITYSLDSSKLAKNAKAYGERTALEWYHKMRTKLGDLKDVTVKDRRGGDITVTGKHKDDTVTIDQHRIINVSSLGTLFHQFPSRIYVNGKFYSEAGYKKVIRGWGVKEIVREKKPKRPPIDPMTRPRVFYFNYKMDYSGRYGGRTDKGVPQTKDAKGMTEAEALKKIKRREELAGYGDRIYDFELQRIYAWNGPLMWSIKSGTPKPK